MAAGQGFKTFTTGEVLTAGDVNGYLMQGINVFTNATARDAAITAPAEGQFAFTKDNNSLWYYDGAAWVASGATGDIEGVTASSPLTGGGTSGTVTVGIQDASTSQRGSVQLSDSTSTTDSTLAATSTAVKAAYDLANGAIPKTLTTTTGDTIYASGANTPARLGIGSTGQVLTVAGGVPTWATPAGGGGKILQVVQAMTTTSTTIASTTLTDTGITATITPTSSTSKILVMIAANSQLYRGSDAAYAGAKLLRGATQLLTWGTGQYAGIGGTASGLVEIFIKYSAPILYLDSPATTSATTYKLQASVSTTANSANIDFQTGSAPSVIILMEVGA